MFKVNLILLLIAHILADFYIQTEKMTHRKDKSYKWVLIHCLYYLVIMLLVGLPIISVNVIIAAISASAFHLLIDMLKFMYISYIKNKRKITQIIERNTFFIDQLLHFVCLVGIAYWGVQNNTQLNEWNVIANFFTVVGVSEVMFIKWIFVLLVIHKPTNIAIQKFLIIYKPISNIGDKESINNAGRFIGTVERIIMLIFLSIEQYSAIGLVLTAKSIARYDKISKEKDFAEYYLLGTLISTVSVIIVSFVL
jgi:hypothetical protein